MTAVAVASPKQQFLDGAGIPLAMGFVHTYLAGTSTESTTWQDRAQLVENENPIPLDQYGSATILLDPGLAYRFEVTDALGAVQPHSGGDNIIGAAGSDVLVDALDDIEEARAAAMEEISAAAAALRPGTYLGPVTNNLRMPDWMNGANTGSTVPRYRTRSAHYAVEALTSIKLKFAWFVVNLTAGDMTERGATVGGISLSNCSQIVQIEYPVGVLHAVALFGGATTGTSLAGGYSMSDLVTVNIPAGAQFWVRRAIWATAGGVATIPLTQFIGVGDFAVHGNAVDYDLTGGVVNPNTLWTYTDNFNAFTCPPCAILQMTSRRTFAFVGNSRTQGAQDKLANSQYGEVGQMARALHGFGMINMGYGNDSMNEYLASHTLRLQTAMHCSDIILGEPTNDYGRKARTTAQILADTAAVVALFTNRQVYAVNLPPTGVTTTDAYATLANQTVDATWQARRAAYNPAIAGVAGLNRVYDISSVLDDGTGKWKLVNGLATTGDGVHENYLGNQAIADSGVISVPAYAAVGP